MTTLFQRGPVEKTSRFELNFDRVTISCHSIDSAICCVQSYVRNLLIAQRDFFTDNGISMLLSAVNIAGSVCEDSIYNPWNLILPEEYSAVVHDLKQSKDVVVPHRKDGRDISERWFGVASVESSVVGETSGQQGVRISSFVEVAKVEYLSQSIFTMQMASTSISSKIPTKEKRKKSETPAKVAIKRRFEFDLSRW